jgi:hypothetical protein
VKGEGGRRAFGASEHVKVDAPKARVGWTGLRPEKVDPSGMGERASPELVTRFPLLAVHEIAPQARPPLTPA